MKICDKITKQISPLNLHFIGNLNVPEMSRCPIHLSGNMAQDGSVARKTTVVAHNCIPSACHNTWDMLDTQ